MPAHGQHQPLHGEHVAHDILVEALIHTLLEAIDELVDLVEHREVLVHGDVHQGMRHTLGTAFELIGVRDHALVDHIDGYAGTRVHGHEQVLRHEEAEVVRLDVVRIIRVLAETQAANDHEQRVPVRVDLDAALRIQCVLDCERMEVEHLFEQRDLMPALIIDVHPEHAGKSFAHDQLPQHGRMQIGAHRSPGHRVDDARHAARRDRRAR